MADINIPKTCARRWTNWHRVFASGQGTRASTLDYILFLYLESGERILIFYMDPRCTKVDKYTAYDRFGNAICSGTDLNAIKMRVYKMLEEEYIKRMS